jgi:hypothetical protein
MLSNMHHTGLDAAAVIELIRQPAALIQTGCPFLRPPVSPP